MPLDSNTARSKRVGKMQINGLTIATSYGSPPFKPVSIFSVENLYTSVWLMEMKSLKATLSTTRENILDPRGLLFCAWWRANCTAIAELRIQAMIIRWPASLRAGSHFSYVTLHNSPVSSKTSIAGRRIDCLHLFFLPRVEYLEIPSFVRPLWQIK